MLQIFNLVSTLILISSFSFTANAEESADVNYPEYQIGKITLTDVTDSFPVNENLMSTSVLDSCNSNEAGTPVNRYLSETTDFADLTTATGQLSVFVDQVINIGQKIWDVVAKGQPVVNVKLDSASAIPKGITCWTQMQGWKAPISRSYRIQYDNILGSTVVDFTFRVISIYGGNYNGKGKYITNASVQVKNLKVNWRFTFDVKVDVPVVFNQGTTEDPLAALQLNVNWKVKTIISYVEHTDAFHLNGNGIIRPLN